MVTAGGETLSQCASVAEMTVSPFALGLENRFKVVFFGNGDHVNRLYGGIKRS